VNTSACLLGDMEVISLCYPFDISMVLILYYIKERGKLILVVWGMFLLPTIRIPFLETIGGAESVSCILVLVLYLGIDRYVTLFAIVVIVHTGV
jgi:hypothetical protein